MSEARAREARQAFTIYWEDHYIEREMSILPADLREPYQWLKTFARDECRRDVDGLVSRAREVGVTIDKTNWTRILKGRWQLDADGNELPAPCVSLKNLLTAIAAIRNKMRVELLRGAMPFVETSTFHTVRRLIEKKLRKDRVNTWAVIIGPTGTQKTACYKELAARNPLLKWTESSDNGSIKELVNRVAWKCGAGRNASYTQARAKIFESFQPLNGQRKGLILDNMQSMVRSDQKLLAMGKPLGTQPMYEFLRSLSEETGCAIIWSITPEDEDQIFKESAYMEQFEGRIGGKDSFLRLPNVPPRKDLVQIAEALGFKNAEKYGERFSQVAAMRGRIRRFFEILQEAKDAADADQNTLSIEYFEDAIEERGQLDPKSEKK